jgi:hypothetical protein
MDSICQQIEARSPPFVYRNAWSELKGAGGLGAQCSLPPEAVGLAD